MTQQPTVLAVSRSGSHTFSKPNAGSIRLIAGQGVEGDAHAGATVKHRSRVARDPRQPNLRQVHLIHAQQLAFNAVGVTDHRAVEPTGSSGYGGDGRGNGTSGARLSGGHPPLQFAEHITEPRGQLQNFTVQSFLIHRLLSRHRLVFLSNMRPNLLFNQARA